MAIPRAKLFGFNEHWQRFRLSGTGKYMKGFRRRYRQQLIDECENGPFGINSGRYVPRAVLRVAEIGLNSNVGGRTSFRGYANRARRDIVSGEYSGNKRTRKWSVSA
jgi:hypothetical protein